MANRERKHNIMVYLDDDELDLLNAKVKLSGHPTRSSYIREIIKTSIIYEIDFSELHQFNWLLSNLTNNLNQIAHQANSCGHATNSDLKEAKRIMEEVWQLQRSMLSSLRLKNQ